MFNTYYQDELRYLRELGREFAEAHPESARFLGESGGDPDVERLLEGCAFLTGRIRQKLDDELPEVAQALLEQLWPQYLCPLPGLCIVQAEHARPNDTDVLVLPAGSMIDSAPVDGTRCRFRTACEVRLLPIKIADVAIRNGPPPELTIQLQCAAGATLAQVALAGGSLRVHCAGTYAQAAGLHACLTRHATAITAEIATPGGRREVVLARGPAKAVGFAAGEELLPGPPATLPALRTLYEFLAFPQRFLFADIPGVALLATFGAATACTLRITLAELPAGIGAVGAGSLICGCTPAANIFPHHGDPIILDPLSSTYRARATSERGDHYEIHSIERIEGIVRGRPQPRPYRAWTTSRPDADEQCRTYAIRRRPSPMGWGSDLLLEIPAALGAGEEETLSLGVLATNRRLPSALAPGDLNQLVAGPVGRIRLRNLGRPTPCAWPSLGRDLEWRLVALLTLNHRSLSEVAALRSLLELHHPRISSDPQTRQTHQRLLDGIERVTATAGTALHQGMPVRGVEIAVAVREDRFDGDGDRHLFTLVLDEVLAQHVTLNSYVRLRVTGTLAGTSLVQPARLGREQLL